jgi:hypothetical protein
MSDLFTRARTVIRRNWREIEPKLAVGLLTGSLTGFGLDLLAQNHIVVTPSVQHFIVVGGFFLGGWIKSSSFPTVQQIATDMPQAVALSDKIVQEAASHQEVVKHPVQLTTSPVAIVSAPGASEPAPTVKLPSRFDNIIANLPSQGGPNPNNQETQKL